MQLDDAISSYVATNQSIQSDRTVRSHRMVAEKFSEHLGRAATVADLTDEQVGLWLRHRATQVSRNTVNGEAATLLALWRWCALRSLCQPPTIRPPQRQQRTPQALSRDQAIALWRAATTTNQEMGEVPGRIYWPALLYVLWQTAERIGAVRALRWEDIDLASGWVVFPASARKFGQQDLARPLTKSAVTALQRLREASPHTPFGEVPGTAWYAMWHALRAEAGLPRWVRPHTIRKSVASHLPSLDDACEMLGHSSSATTKRNYRDPRIADGRQLVDKLFDPGERRRRWLGWLTG